MEVTTLFSVAFATVTLSGVVFGQLPTSQSEIIVFNLLKSECPGSEQEVLSEPADGLSLFNRLMNKLKECRQKKNGVTPGPLPTSQSEIIVFNLLKAECPGSEQEVLREPANGLSLYNRLMNKLIECRQKISGIITTTTLKPVITYKTPKECLTAKNLTESWRLDREGKNFKPGGKNSNGGYACDMNTESLSWFRLSSNAGNTKMLNKCPKKYSCGAAIPFWSDETASDVIGQIKTINTYAVRGDNCKSYTKKVFAMRCSPKSNDVIYKVRDQYLGSCGATFCAMKSK